MVPVIAVRKGNPRHIRSVDDLASWGVRIAICSPSTTLLGEFAGDIFRSSSLKKMIEKNIVTQMARPDGLLTMLILGSIDAGVIWHFYGSMAENEIDMVFFPPSQVRESGKMQIAVSAYCRNEEIAARYIDFATSAEGREIFRKRGYFTGGEEEGKYVAGSD